MLIRFFLQFGIFASYFLFASVFLFNKTAGGAVLAFLFIMSIGLLVHFSLLVKRVFRYRKKDQSKFVQSMQDLLFSLLLFVFYFCSVDSYLLFMWKLVS